MTTDKLESFIKNIILLRNTGKISREDLDFALEGSSINNILSEHIMNKATINTSPNGVISYDVINNGEDFIIKTINPAIRKMTNIGDLNVVGKSVFEIYKTANNKRYNVIEDFRTVVRTGKDLSVEGRYIDEKLNVDLYLKNNISMITPTVLRSIVIDQTDLVKTYMRQKNVLHMLIHDFKTPVDNMVQLADLLGEAKEDKDFESMNDYTQRIRTIGSRMTSSLQTMTYLGSLEAGTPIEKDIYNLRQISESAADIYSQRLIDNDMLLENLIPEDLQIEVNPMISHVFQNYISNAIKYASDGKKIVLSTEVDSEYITVLVTDFSKNKIPEDMVEKIFKQGVQLNNKGKLQGQGLGLAIIKDIVTEHDGTVGLRQTANDKSVYFTIPFMNCKYNNPNNNYSNNNS